MAEQSKQFEILDLIPGEAAFRAYGSTLSELFSNAASALFSVMVELSSVEDKVERIVDLDDPDQESLLIDFLSELVYLKDAEAMLFARFEVAVERKEEESRLHASIWGEPINRGKHRLGVDVKGVTLHRYEFKQLPVGYSAQVILDV